MKTRQSSKKKVKNANSVKKEKPPDIVCMESWYSEAKLVNKKQKVKIHFLTKCFLPELAMKIQNDIRIINARINGMRFGDFQEKSISKKKIKELEKDIKILSNIDPENSFLKQIIKEQKSYLSGIRYLANIH